MGADSNDIDVDDTDDVNNRRPRLLSYLFYLPSTSPTTSSHTSKTHSKFYSQKNKPDLLKHIFPHPSNLEKTLSCTPCLGASMTQVQP